MRNPASKQVILADNSQEIVNISFQKNEGETMSLKFIVDHEAQINHYLLWISISLPQTITYTNVQPLNVNNI